MSRFTEYPLLKKLAIVLLIGFSGHTLANSPLKPIQTHRFAPSEQAFKFNFNQRKEVIDISWKIQKGYYLYKDKIRVSHNGKYISNIKLPEGIPHQDPYFGEVDIYKDALQIRLPILENKLNNPLVIHYQGCAAAGFCYPPESKVIPIQQ